MSTDQLPQPPEPSWAKRGFDLHQLERYGRECAQKAAKEERERCLQAVEAIMQGERDARDVNDGEQMHLHRYAVLVCGDVKDEIRKDHP